jgi:Domain of unknown function (DUF4384)
MRRGLRFFWLVLAVTAVAAAAPQKPESGAGWPRGILVGSGENRTQERIAGRLALLKVEDGRARQVGAGHPFRSGDQFRFEVTASRDGWLYVLYRPPGGELQQLWPPPSRGAGERDIHRVRAHMPLTIPSANDAFVFDSQVGQEYFYVALQAHAVPPMAPTGPAAPRPTEPEIVNFSVRGDVDPVGVARRGVVVDPGPKAADLHLYFAPAAGDDGALAVLELRLRHQ